LAGSEVVVYCPFDFNQPQTPSPAGYFRSFESTNKDRIGGIYQHAPEAKIVVATHPSTEIVQSIHQNSNVNLGQVIGISGYLINTDLKVEISEAVGVSVEDVVSLIIGNDDEYHMLPQYCCVGGIPIDQLLSQNQIAKLGSNVRNQPKKLVYTDFVHTISVLTAQVVKTILLNKKRIIAVTTMIEANGIEVCLNLPAKIGRNGAEKLTPLHLTNKQLEQFMALVKKAATQQS
jgi:malate/lactate dehydrogenase